MLRFDDDFDDDEERPSTSARKESEDVFYETINDETLMAAKSDMSLLADKLLDFHLHDDTLEKPGEH